MVIDLKTAGIYGDIAHCPLPDLLESAEALLSLLPRVKHRGLWGLGKAYDADCYLYTTARSYKAPERVSLEWTASDRPFKLVAIPWERERFFGSLWYEPLIGSVREGRVSSGIEGVPDLTAEARARHKTWLEGMERNRGPQQLKLELKT